MTWAESQELPSLRKEVTLEQIAAYSRASGDVNPVHLDPAFAAQSTFGRIVAHGMLGYAFVSEMLTHAFGHAWLENGLLRVPFHVSSYPGDQLSTYGKVTKVITEAGKTTAQCAIGCRKQDGQDVITGDATLTLVP